MNLQCIIHYTTALTNYFLNNFFDIVVVATAFFFMFFTARFYVQPFKYKDSRKSCRSKSEALHNLHEATFTNDLIKAIESMKTYPEAVNYLHPLDGYSPFMRACLNANTQLVNIMLKFGADVSLKSANGETPFYLAAFYHVKHPRSMNATCIRALYYAGSDVNATNGNGFTALQLAANFGNVNLAKWLLDKGASTSVQPYPYLIARSKGHNDTARLLKNLSLPALE